ncbi:hypothetical protein K501DRAFT_63922 [Backusella circina FSU 941]|nr:hypothetical protein K501DRAFT_63922 [Backusella circina FSU 941]
MFIIENIPEFTEVVLPRLFKHCKFPSFVRQLNIYGFQRDTDARKTKDTKDKESCRWYHPFFRPGRRDLFHLIRRKAARYSRRKRSKVEEDPETILNVGSGDESDGEQSPQLNNSNEESLRSPSVSPASENMQPISTTSSSQLQLTYSDPAHTTLTTGLHAPAESPAEHNSLQSIPEEHIQIQNQQQQQQHPPTHHHHHPPVPSQQQQQNQPTQEKLDDMIVTSPTPLPQSDPLMRDQELRFQLYHMKRDYENMRSYFDEQLNSAQIQIDEQHLHIQQLETALGITRHTVKPNTIQNPRYLCTTTTPYNGHFLPLNNNSNSNTSSTTSQNRLMTTAQQQRPMEYGHLKTSPVHPTNTVATAAACGDYNFYNLPHEQNVHTPPSWLHSTFPSNSLQQRRDSIPAAMNMTDPTMVVAAGSNSTTRSTSSSIPPTIISSRGSNISNVNRMDPSSVDLSDPLQYESKYTRGCRF